jgi:hypothetical protein
MGLTGSIVIANLRPLTHSRCLILMKELLNRHGRAELEEAMLEVLGFAHLNRPQVEANLRDATETFDRAVKVTRTPVPYAFKLHSHVRPYVVEASQEMI